MSEFTLKQNDLVYYPLRSNKIFKLNNSRYVDEGYPLEIYVKDFSQTVSANGKTNSMQNVPVVFPATQEWYERLSYVYPNLKKPPIKKSSKEIIQALLNDGNDDVLCWVSNTKGESNNSEYIVVITHFDDYFRDVEGDTWIYATPIYPIKSLKQIITDYVNGKVITENKDE